MEAVEGVGPAIKQQAVFSNKEEFLWKQEIAKESELWSTRINNKVLTSFCIFIVYVHRGYPPKETHDRREHYLDLYPFVSAPYPYPKII